jgi:hypothetical protein
VSDLYTSGQAPNTTSPDLVTLTETLYARIEQRLRDDLLHERERLGCLPDL